MDLTEARIIGRGRRIHSAVSGLGLVLLGRDLWDDMGETFISSRSRPLYRNGTYKCTDAR